MSINQLLWEMSIVTEAYKIEFYKFLNGDSSLREIEAFVFEQIDLEQKLGRGIYEELLSFDFQDPWATEVSI